MIELDHQHIEYGSVNTTLAWKISSKYSCSISKIQSHPACLPNNVDTNTTIDRQTQITVLTEKFHISGHLADFSLSSLSVEPSVECPQLLGTVRFNGK